ncbi:MAG TPA: AmmeMemoRadiSam system radical SAM enzyme [Selenomonadales bacterium]|nr:AmmeMemoRadiSam system radical SAM enzyme [Selenomonadales bacterium]
MREALFYEPHPGGAHCRLCPKECVIGEGKAGFCRTRQNLGGVLYAKNYGACTAYALDPIEKKPLYHFYPGSYIYSIGTWGCNFSCRFCQNWQIAQAEPDTVSLTPEQAVKMAAQAGKRNIGLAYTYSEPGVWYEFVRDTAQEARRHGLKNVLVTNGSINPEPLAELLPLMDAFNIDVKAFNETFYREVCAGRLADVKRTVALAASAAHVEITCLLIPGLNDRPDELAAMAEWLAGINQNIPLHVSRYFPSYRLSIPATPLSTLESAYRAARRHLPYVYVGNAGGDGVNTRCPSCSSVVIDREKGISRLENKSCPRCGEIIPISGEIRF